MTDNLTIQDWTPWRNIDASKLKPLDSTIRLGSTSGFGFAGRSLNLLLQGQAADGSLRRGGALLDTLALTSASQTAGLTLSTIGSGGTASWEIRSATAQGTASALATVRRTSEGLRLTFGAAMSDALASQLLMGLQLRAQATSPRLSMDLLLEPVVTASLKLTSQWNGTFEGTLTVTNPGTSLVGNWSASLHSRYALRNVSNFSLSQSQLADGSWQITLTPPSWGQSLAPGASASSYVQGVIPSGGRLASLDPALVLLPGPGSDQTGGTAPPAGTGTLTPGGRNSGNAGDSLWGESFFAPYVDMALYPVPDLVGLARKNGVGLFTGAFLQATPTGEAAWGGLPALALDSTHQQAAAIRSSLSQLRAAGGDIMVSLGGAAGTSLAQYFSSHGRSAADLAASYGRVVNNLQLNRIDFDIEGAALADPAANRLNSAALALLQKSSPDLEIWYTLPVLPQGLTGDGLTVVRLALEAGVKLDGVNVMAMDYGDSAAPPGVKSMGQYAIDAANATFGQLSQLFAGKGQGFGWNQLGVTPMIGVNDVTSEVFTPADAQLVEDFARSRNLGMLSMWSMARDTPGPLGQVTPTHSGLSAPAGSFNGIWGDYGTDPIIAPGGSTGGTGGGAGSLPMQTIAVAAGTSNLSASDSTAERFQLSYAWGRTLTIRGFNPSQDILDLKNFWAEGQKAKVVPISGGSMVALDFNNQQVVLPGVAPSALTPPALAIWQG